MRVKKAWVVARKDLAEFRANKQILLTLAVFPIIMSIIPTLVIVPIASLYAQAPPPEPNLQLFANNTIPQGEYTNIHFFNATVGNSTLSNGYMADSYVNNSTVKDVVARHSLLDNVTVSESILIDCVLRNSHYDISSTILINTVTSGTTEAPTRDLKQLLPLFTHSILLFVFFSMAVAMPTTIAAYSFVGEKSNKTLEPLLATPITDAELLWGKYLAIFVPVMALILLAFAIFTVAVDALTIPILGYLLIPDLVWLLAIFVVTPLICLIGIAVNVLISSKVNDVRTAQQYSALIIFPLMLGFFMGPIVFSVAVGLEFIGTAALIMLAAMALLVWLSLRVFNREGILTTWK